MSLLSHNPVTGPLLPALFAVQVGVMAWGFWAAGAEQALPLGAALALSLASALLLARAWALTARRLRRGEVAQAERMRRLDADPLTGALARGAFMARLRAEIAAGAPLSLLLIDVDHFKSVNDSLGHAAGDAILQRLSEVATRSFPGATLGRLGGDEFALLLGAAPAQAQVAAERFLAALREPHPLDGRLVGIDVSIGLAAAPDHGSFEDELMLHADLALYESKRRGRGCVTAFDEAMRQDRKQRRFIERELRAAILLDELDLHYQPLVDVGGTVVGVEGLVRWRHPLRGMIMPGDFIPVAEQSPLIDSLGEWVLRRACRDAAALPGRFISLNLSGAQLKRDGFVETVRRVLAETGVAPARFTFEITETVAVSATPGVLARLEALRAMGLRLALDDFGTGNMGLSALRALPVDGIKIDRSYVQAMGSDEIASIVVSALGAIGRARGMPVVAEGIENDAHLAMAKAAGCSLFQGYLIGRPAPLAPPLALTA
ncbi:bifunctional diguanylate cyclase/phosphodiesterase [Aureimonas sp. AU4]|uniref:putative bifunctional diguanylate cyclase/phosphodiesterase n=1 Tax=Aureimonas sp. AU4 TaxID=1638163 RepID=UPI0007855FFA|nr:EAL domain-containing protein [Aureimonas sp. AU4]